MNPDVEVSWGSPSTSRTSLYVIVNLLFGIVNQSGAKTLTPKKCSLLIFKTSPLKIRHRESFVRHRESVGDFEGHCGPKSPRISRCRMKFLQIFEIPNLGAKFVDRIPVVH